MGEVISINAAKKHVKSLIKCKCCDYKWVAVYPFDFIAIECPNCHASVNEYGIRVFVNKCDDCGRQFSVCPYPKVIDDFRFCLADDCSSYDESRDADIYFDRGLVKIGDIDDDK